MTVYLTIVVVGIICRLITEKMYEDYKKREGFKNNYKGWNLFKPFKEYPILSIICAAFMYGVPAIHLIPIIACLSFKKTKKLMLAKEMLMNTVQKVDNDIIDVFYKENDGDSQEAVEVLTGDVVDNTYQNEEELSSADEMFSDRELEELAEIFADMVVSQFVGDAFGVHSGTPQAGNHSDEEALAELFASVAADTEEASLDENLKARFEPIDLSYMFQDLVKDLSTPDEDELDIEGILTSFGNHDNTPTGPKR